MSQQRPRSRALRWKFGLYQAPGGFQGSEHPRCRLIGLLEGEKVAAFDPVEPLADKGAAGLVAGLAQLD